MTRQTTHDKTSTMNVKNKKSRYLMFGLLIINFIFILGLCILTLRVERVNTSTKQDLIELEERLDMLEQDIVGKYEDIDFFVSRLEYEIELLEKINKSSEESEKLELEIRDLIEKKRLTEKIYNKLTNEYLEDFNINDFEIWLKTNHYELWEDIFK